MFYPVSFVIFLGEMIREKDRCPECRGKKVAKESKILQVHVDKGMRDGQKITFRGEGDRLGYMLFSIKTASWSDIPGKVSTLFTKLSLFVKKRSRMLLFLVGVVTICCKK